MDGGEFRIRLAEPRDAEAVRMIRAEGWLSARASVSSYVPGLDGRDVHWAVEGDDASAVERSLAAVRASIAAGCCFVMDSSDGVIGFAIAIPEGDVVFLHSLYVSRRGIGVGSALLLEVLWQHANRDARLIVNESDARAVRFYERHGFIVTGPADDGLPAQVIDVPLPAIEMRRARDRH